MFNFILSDALHTIILQLHKNNADKINICIYVHDESMDSILIYVAVVFNIICTSYTEEVTESVVIENLMFFNILVYIHATDLHYNVLVFETYRHML